MSRGFGYRSLLKLPGSSQFGRPGASQFVVTPRGGCVGSGPVVGAGGVAHGSGLYSTHRKPRGTVNLGG